MGNPIRSTLSSIASRADTERHKLAHRQEYALQAKYSGHSMIPVGRYVDNLLLAGKARSVPGLVIECGVWRGGMIAGIAELLGPTARTYVLADSFQGLPPVADIDGEGAKAWETDTESPLYHDHARAPEEAAREAMRMAGVADPTVLAGWFEDTFTGFAETCGPIAVLRLDGDLYSSTMTCLEALFPLVSPGGLVIFDDYSHWDGCTKAVHRYLADQERTEPIRNTPRGLVHYLFKR